MEITRSLFFSALTREAQFSMSQVAGLEFAKAQLRSMNVSNRHAHTTVDLIKSTVPLTDAENLRALDVYFQRLNPTGQRQLCIELVFAVVASAGAIYVQQRNYSSASRVDFATKRRSNSDTTTANMTNLHGSNPHLFLKPKPSKSLPAYPDRESIDPMIALNGFASFP